MTQITDYFEMIEYAVVLPLADKKGDRMRIIGSATMIIPGIFITSRHLVQQYMKDHDLLDYANEDWSVKQNFESTYNLDLLHILKNKKLIVWTVTKVHPMKQSDLALLTASRLNDDENIIEKVNMRVRIDLHMPAVGTNVTALGYPTKNAGSDASEFAALDKNGFTTHTLQLRKCEGPVEAIESRVTQRSPRIQTSLAIDGGMSGGPVFNTQGELSCINADGFEPNEHHTQYTSFAVPLFTAFHTPVSVTTQEDGKTEMTLFQLASNGYLEVKGLKHFRGNLGSEVWDSVSVKCPDCP